MKLSFSWRRWMDRLSGLSRDSRRPRLCQRRAPATRRLVLESLEDRSLLSASALGAALPAVAAVQAATDSGSGSATTPPPSQGTPAPTAGSSATQEWNQLTGFYQLLCSQYFAKMGMDPSSSYSWGSLFADFNINLGIAKGASPMVSLMLFNFSLSEGGDPYSSGILATNWTGHGGAFTPASGSPNERVAAYYQDFGIAADGLTNLYAQALAFGQPDDAIAALIAAQHNAHLV